MQLKYEFRWQNPRIEIDRAQGEGIRKFFSRDGFTPAAKFLREKGHSVDLGETFRCLGGVLNFWNFLRRLGSRINSGRADEIRTHDLLHPMHQVHPLLTPNPRQ
jgi:hypothetical protein